MTTLEPTPGVIGAGVVEGKVAIAFQLPTTMFAFNNPEDAAAFAVQLLERAVSLGAELPPTVSLNLDLAPPPRLN